MNTIARRPTTRRPFFLALAAVLAYVAATPPGVTAAGGTDAVSSLPLYPGFSSPQVINDVPMCGSGKGTMALYYPSHLSLQSADRWFAAHLPGFERMSGRTDRPQLGFYKPGGKLIVGITGDPKDANVYAVTYVLANPPLAREHAMGMLTQHC